ncbi:unnamed protein product [Penicillium roqueforti FM164]|uniref:Genomic scaffold, ProqFM164S02 n=1 Tax=Penicillium roqueforti (strain FM164) TaxID=1365484 RepID=W6QPT2_PENRF|nr:unnamed protein product [Penicillium roqueforti FM164]
MDREALSEVESRCIKKFEDTFYDVTDRIPEDSQMWTRADQIVFYLEVLESQSDRKRGRSTSSIQDLSHWRYIKLLGRRLF